VSEDPWRARWPKARWRGRRDLAVSVTGIAGPGGSEFKPEGRVCFGVARKGRAVRVETVEFGALGRAGCARPRPTMRLRCWLLGWGDGVILADLVAPLFRGLGPALHEFQGRVAGPLWIRVG
jgi:hypothetical protein